MDILIGILIGAALTAAGIGYALRAPLKAWVIRAVETKLIGKA
jgi:hypothetical protein